MSGSRRRHAVRGAGVLAAAALVLAGCSSSSDGSDPISVDKDLLSSEVQAQLTKKQGRPAAPVSCPDNLDADIGATTTCLMTTPNGVYNVTVTVTNVEWDGFGNFGVGNAIFDATVADKPNP